MKLILNIKKNLLSLLCLGCLLIISCSYKELHPIVSFSDNSDTATIEEEPNTNNETDNTTDSQISTDIEEPDTETESTPDTDTNTDTDSDTYPIINLPKWVGSATQNRTYPSDFFELWDQVTPENEGKWESIEYFRNEMYWHEFDSNYNIALENNIKFKQHNFIWGLQQPLWIPYLSPIEQAQEVEEWISSFCSRYPDIEMINVVSEPIHTPPSYTNALGGDGDTGYDWVIWAYEKARQYCPNSDLLLNEYNVLQWRTDEVIKLATILKERNLIDGIGCAAHGLERASLDVLSRNLDRVARLGLPIYISEYDVNIADDDEQLAVLSSQFTLFYNHPSVAGITFWGYVENRTWAPNAYLRRADGSHRPALTWLINYLGR